MADESDYTKMWSGVFTPPRVGDDDRGVYLLDDEASVGRNGKIYDGCTRALYYDDDDAHPRTYPGGQRRPGPDAVTLQERAAYTQGSRVLGHPGPRGMVASSREGRRAVDNAVWDSRPPHFADDTPNALAHLYVDPAARGPPLFSKDPTYPGFRQVDRFGSSPAGSGYGGLTPRDTLEVVKVVLFFIIVALAAMWLMVDSAEKRIGREVVCALRVAMCTRGAGAPAGA